MNILLFILFVFSQLCQVLLSYKILVYSQTLTRSHVILNAKIAEALASDGHNVTILEVEYFEPLSEFEGSNAKGVKKISVKSNLNKAREKIEERLNYVYFNEATTWSIIRDYENDNHFQRTANEFCEVFLDTQKHLVKQLESENFDLFIGEQINFCGTGLSYLFKIPIHILLVSCPIQEHVSSLLGLPFPSSYVPSIYGIPMNDKMNIKQRFSNLIATLMHERSFYYGIEHLNEIFKQRFGLVKEKYKRRGEISNYPNIKNIIKSTPLVFVNVDEFVEFPRPIHSNIVYIGGLGFEKINNKNKQLSEPYLNEIKKGKLGTVYFSLGSLLNTSTLPNEFIKNIFETFKSLEDWHFIVKISEGDLYSKELVNNCSNIFLTNWAPQRAILEHPQTKLFISHGGYNSLIESALAACPIISFGFFAEQRRNSLIPERNGWGLSFNKALLLKGKDEFLAIIKTILEDPKFTEGAKRLSKILANKPFTAREKLLKNIRFLELNGGKLPELMPESRNLNIFVLYNLDILAILIITIIGLLILFYLLIIKLFYNLIINFKLRKNKKE
ncbi:hypothetical protein Mgra_00004973 [Meloidogyne graminicola]|uniref:glucuronosyltransferase n=1 Tax=Meloidogyne graminicola TaxID=189291 RepID=A0A8S9ZQ50_9BILA|nr:hypothetical protein Mgra_00004973 [Meloidogyne graminicola]